MVTPWETMKQQPTATPWENRQNCGVRHKVLKVGEDTEQDNSSFQLSTCHCSECGTIKFETKSLASKKRFFILVLRNVTCECL
jgi:hypothetical protein